jgi:hypothetical protein
MDELLLGYKRTGFGRYTLEKKYTAIKYHNNSCKVNIFVSLSPPKRQHICKAGGKSL